MFIDGLGLAIRSLVTLGREGRRWIPYHELFQHAEAEEDAVHAGTPNHRSKCIKVLLLESEAFTLHLIADVNPQQEIGTVHSMHGDSMLIVTTQISPTTKSFALWHQKNFETLSNARSG